MGSWIAFWLSMILSHVFCNMKIQIQFLLFLKDKLVSIECYWETTEDEIAGGNISNLHYSDNTILVAKNKTDLQF